MNLDIEPRVTYDGDIILKLALEISAKGPDQNVAGQNLPSFFSRKVETRLRLRDGESNLLAGLLRENERKSLKGFPGISHVPILRELFASNDKEIVQTDIVMLLTPHIVRTHALTQKDFAPVFVGTQDNLGLAGPAAAHPAAAAGRGAPAARRASGRVPRARLRAGAARPGGAAAAPQARRAGDAVARRAGRLRQRRQALPPAPQVPAQACRQRRRPSRAPLAQAAAAAAPRAAAPTRCAIILTPPGARP